MALKKFLMFGVVAGLLVACGDEASDKSPVQVAEESSSSVDEVLSSSVNVEESSSSVESEGLSSSVESGASSSSEKSTESSSGKNTEPAEVSSCSVAEESSSSMTVEPSSSSVKIEQSSSSEKAEASSSSVKVQESSSSVKVEESSSSAKTDASSSSEKPVESSSSEKVVESSSSDGIAESSSSEYYKLSWDYLNSSIPYDTIIDSRDGQVYKVVTIGSLIWMAENLNYYDTIQSPDLKRHSWCLNDRVVNCEHYGRYYDNPIALDYDSTQTSAVYKRYMNEEGGYDSLSVVGVCPNGWRIPTRSEWLHLDSSCKVRSAQWNGENSCGVSIYNSGYRYLYQDSVSYFRNGAYFWTASYNSSAKPSTIVFEKNGLSGVYGIFRGSGLSIRCVKDD